jgi:hypothetical protein
VEQELDYFEHRTIGSHNGIMQPVERAQLMFEVAKVKPVLDVFLKRVYRDGVGSEIFKQPHSVKNL